MDRIELVQVLAKLKDEQREVSSQVAALQHRESSLTQAISGLEGLLGEETSLTGSTALKITAAGTVAPMYPRGTEAIRRVLQDEGREMTVKEISEALIQRGWAPRSLNPENATSSNASRAAESLPDVERHRGEHGAFVYRYVAVEEQGTDANDATGEPSDWNPETWEATAMT